MGDGPFPSKLRKNMIGMVKWTYCAALASALVACESSLEVGLPNSKILSEKAFADDGAASSSMVGVYIDMYQANSFASGSNVSFTCLAGLSSDELGNVLRTDPNYAQIEDNEVSIGNTLVLGLWNSMYKTIYEANAVLEGINQSRGLSTSIRDRLRGEALAVRGFTYFYLINTFGNVPLVTSTDYTENESLSKTSASDIYDQIKNDLQAAEGLLPENYPSSHRVRFNKWAATALLARIYLYLGDWARAEDKASNVINSTNFYGLESNLNNVFLGESTEAILQLKPADGSSFTNEGYYFGPNVGPTNNILNESFVSSFDDNDMRKSRWVLTLTSGPSTIYLPSKYKRYLFGTETTEYSVVLRLAEMYLIRAEARVMQDKLKSAIVDVDKIRSRAGLPLIADVSPQVGRDELLVAIDQERKFELFTEWGHRWLDLKRRGRSTEILQPLKLNWNPSDVLYPIPQSEIVKNTNLLPQNTGY
jgi:hypothetical protein